MTRRRRGRAPHPPRAALTALVLLAGCKGCKDDHPYVPYTIADAPAAAPEDAAPPLPGELDAGAFHAREGSIAPPNASQWALEGLALSAPPGNTFAVGLVADLDADGLRDAVALVQKVPTGDADGSAERLDVVLYRGVPGGGVVGPESIVTPPVIALGPTCAPRLRLAQVGRQSVAVETGGACDHASGERWVAAVTIARDAKVHFRATLRDPEDSGRLSLDIDGTDRDRDGLDDVAIRVTLEGGAAPFEPGPKVSATVRWFDRPAGMSRDPDEPEGSFRALASSAAARAAKVREAPAVPRFVEQVRALYRALCADAGGARITDIVGASALSCGASKGLEEAGLAEVRAYALSGDPLRAIAALGRAQVPPATRTTTRAADAEGWIAQAAPISATPSVLRALGAIPRIERSRAPAWGALAFEPSGKLLVRTVAGVVRADPVQGDEASADDVPAWRSDVVAPDAAFRFVEAYDACNGVSLHATFMAGGGREVRDIALPVAPPFGSRCARPGERGDPASTLAVAWGARGLEAIVADEPILVAPDLTRATPSVAALDQPVTPGSPRSPGGKVLVVPTSLGILVRGQRSRLLRARELDGGYAELRDCAVSDDAARVACVRGGRAFVGVWGAE